MTCILPEKPSIWIIGIITFEYKCYTYKFNQSSSDIVLRELTLTGQGGGHTSAAKRCSSVCPQSGTPEEMKEASGA